VLIPRPETEELVEWVLREMEKTSTPSQSPRILDIGTGSGCIAIAIKKKMKAATVYACDISEAALEVARQNAAVNDTDITLLHCDFLDELQRNSLPNLDVIVSNPPYVPVADKASMHLNVLKHEPHLALFVANDDPLMFYKAIAQFSEAHLSKNGTIFVEIHEEFAQAVQALFRSGGFQNPQLRKDLQGRDRMVMASRK
jgi:release factor glutamine methyltransferase